MRLLRTQQTSFTSGELDPRLAARIEVSRYYAGAALLRNVLVMPQGAVRRRPGMRHVLELNDGTDGIRLLPFAFNTEQTYAFALTNGQFRVWLPDGTLVATVTGAPWSGAQAAAMNRTQSADTMLLTNPTMRPQRIRRNGSNTAWLLDNMPMSNVPTFDYGSGSEAVISTARGWPESITFHDGRLYLAGFKSRPSTFMASVVGDYFNFDQGTGLDNQAIYATLNTDQVNAIYQVASGRALQLYTTGAEFAVTVTPPITPKNLSVVQQTRRGIKRAVPVVEVDGATMFVQRGGAAVRQFLFDTLEQAYRSDLLSLLAPHLIKDPVDMAARKAAVQDDADNVLLVNSDGTITVLSTLRAQEVTAFSRWETAGTILSTCALQSGEVFFATQRNGTVRVETWDETCRLDASVRKVDPAGFTTVSGLSHLIGQTATLLLDDAYLGTVTITADTLTLPRTAYAAEIGLANDLAITTMPLEPRDQSGALIGRLSRIVRASARVQDTSQFDLNAAPLVLRKIGAAPAPPLGSQPPSYTGDVTLRGIIGWQERQSLALTQPAPGPFTCLALSVQLAVSD